MKKPNIVVFMTDQQNAQTMYAHNVAKTPNIDRFLADSMQFTNCYTCSPHCCPSRATFFSGLYPTQHGVWNNVEVGNALSRGLYDNVKLFSEHLKDVGYHTSFSGKWHVSAYQGPTDKGFDEVLMESTSNSGKRMTPCNLPESFDWDTVYDGSKPIDQTSVKDPSDFGRIVREGYPTYYQFGDDQNPFGDADVARLACEKIESYQGDQPLLMYVGTIGPHDPYKVPQEFLDLYNIDDMQLPDSFVDEMQDKPALYRRTRMQFALSEAEHKESLRRYMAFVSFEDHLFGQVLDSIEKSGKKDDTVVIYLSDHGDYLGAHGLWAKGLPCFREAYQVPCAIRIPNQTTQSQCDALVSIADVAPTILALAGIETPDEIVGRSLLPLIADPDAGFRSEIYTQTNGNEIYGIQRAVFDKKWKYVYNSFDFDELYDLESDPTEQHNLLPDTQYNDVVRDLCKKMWRFARDTKDDCTCPYIMVGLAPYGPGIVLEDR